MRANSIPSLFAVVVVTTAAWACGGSPEPAPAPAPEPTTGEEATGETAGQKMWHHFWDIIMARDAVIGAKLDEVAPPLSRVASGQFGMDVPPDWMNWIEDMQAQAGEGAKAASLQDAALAVSTVAAACADCHRTTGGGPKLEGDTRGYKPEGVGLHEAMARHVWAAEELWLGMVAPRHEAWMRGATALASMELPQDDPPINAATGEAPPAPEGEAAPPPAPEGEAAPPPTPPDPSKSPLWAQLEKMRELGKRAQQAAQPAEKTAIYAEMLAQCASCHADARL